MKSIASSRFATVYAFVLPLVIAVLSARCGRSSPNLAAPATGRRPVLTLFPCNAVSERARILRSIDERRARVRPRGAIHRCDGGEGGVACRPDRRDRPAAWRADQESPTGLRRSAGHSRRPSVLRQRG